MRESFLIKVVLSCCYREADWCRTRETGWLLVEKLKDEGSGKQLMCVCVCERKREREDDRVMRMGRY